MDGAADFDLFLRIVGCLVLQSVSNGLRVSDWINAVVVLGHKEKSTGAAVCYERCLSNHATPCLYELLRFDLVYASHDVRSCRLDIGLDALHLRWELLQRSPADTIYRPRLH